MPVYNTIQQLTKLFQQSKVYKSQEKEKSVLVDKINDQIRWILEHRYETQDFNGQSISCLWSILLNYNYNCIPKKDLNPLPEDIWISLLEATTEHIPNVKFKELLNILTVFSKINIWHYINNDFYLKFGSKFLNIVAFYFQDLNLVKTLRLLTHLGFSWKSFPYILKEKTFKKMSVSQKELSIDSFITLVWSCAALDIPWNDLPNETRHAVLDKFPELIKENVEIIKSKPAIDLTSRTEWTDATSILRQIQQIRLHFGLSLNSGCIADLNDALTNCIKIEVTISELNPLMLQNNVTRIIKEISQEYEIDFQKEAAPLCLKPVDIYFPAYKIILEVNGPHHYNKHGLPRPNDIMNERIYIKNGFQVFCIKQSEWNQEKNKYNFILDKLRPLLPIQDLTSEKSCNDAEIESEKNKNTAVSKTFSTTQTFFSMKKSADETLSKSFYSQKKTHFKK